ncbi:MAG: HlyD family efflux transporter periplasmic adaptor subunit [Verrucomicrobiae bacterium]|nr:HlyD family efflux transporter periplasmic adaptor subunit [Verrucomicrobiae bacterium]
MSVETAQFEQAKARIQNWVREIAVLSRSNVPIAEYFSQFLDRVVKCIDAHGGAIWLLGSQDMQLLCDIRIDDIEFKSNPGQRNGVQRAIKDVLENKRPLVVGPLGPDLEPQSSTTVSATEDPIVNQTKYPLYYVPLMVDNQAVGVLHLWQRPYRDPKTNQEFITFLTSISTYAESYLKSRKMVELARESQQYQKLLMFSNALAGQLDETQISITVVNHAREILNCDRCVIVAKHGDRWNVTSVSGVGQPQKKSQLVKLLTALGETIPDTGPKMFVRGDEARSSKEADAYFSESNLNTVLALPIKARDGNRLGTFLAEGAIKTPWPDVANRTAALLLDPVALAITTAREYKELPFLLVMQQVQKTKTAFLGPKRNRTLAKIGIPIAALIILSFMPWKLTVEGDCTLLPTIRSVVSSEIGGRILQVFVKEGDDVRAGQVLAKLDDTKIKLDLAVARQEKARWEAEAGRQGIAGDEGQRRVAELQAELAEHQIARLNHDLSETEIRSPIEGRVLTKDLHLRVGQVIQDGDVFAEVANLELWQAVISVREADVSQLDERLRQGKPVYADFILYSRTTQRKTAVVRDLSKVGQLSTTAERQNVFQVTADVTTEGDLSREFKPGYTGRAQLDAGWRFAGYVFSRRFVNFLRVEWLF